MATAEGGRFDFDDGGSYVGEWCEGRAHGLGIATGPDNQGEYSGEWTMGFESRGVYVWPSGNMYAGGWLKGKRHGEGTQVKGRWIYRGAFTAGFCGRYGIKESLINCARYEGSWHLNQFDGFGVETNSDGSMYAGAWSKGMRQGLGVRKSAPYGVASENSHAVRAAQSQSSLPSNYDSDRGGWRGPGSSGGSGSGDPTDRSRSETIRSGFVLRATSTPAGRSRNAYRSNSPRGDKKSSFRKFIMRKLRKPKSTGDLTSVGPHTIGGASSNTGSGRFMLRAVRAGGSLRSNLSGGSQFTANSVLEHQSRFGETHQAFDTLDEPLGPNVTETYSGQWNEDRRSGYGVAERSDGLRYEGEWFNNKKDGFGVSSHPDGNVEEGRYKENLLIQPLVKRNKLYLLRHSKLKDSVEEATKKAKEAAKEAQEKSAEIAHQRAQTARSVANTADAKAEDAQKLSEEARAIATEFASDFVQMGIQWERENPYSHMLTRSGAARMPHAYGQMKGVGAPGSVEGAQNPNLNVNSLEVSGGNRRGSFRSSFKRNTNGSPSRAQENNSNQVVQNQNLSPNSATQQYATVLQVDKSQPKFESIDRTASNKPISPSPSPRRSNAVLYSAEIISSVSSQAHVARLETLKPQSPPIITPIPAPSSLGRSTLPQQMERIAQGRPMTRAATAGFSGPNMSPFDQLENLRNKTRRVRRRTLPSIMTTAPVQPVAGSREPSIGRTTGTSKTVTNHNAMIGNRAGEKHFVVPGLTSDLNVVHSTEDLSISMAFGDLNDDDLETTYIIEDGIRKRVQPILRNLEQQQQQQMVNHPAGISPERGQRMKREPRSGSMKPDLDADYDFGELLPLRSSFKIEPVANLAGGIDVSMPDVSKGLPTGPAGLGAPRLGLSGFLTRDEVCRLSQQRRHELLLDQERKKRGEIIIRLADIKDWLRANIVAVLVLLVNIGLAFLFINLVNNTGLQGPETSAPKILTHEEKLAAASAAEEAVKKALRAANAASRPRDTS